MQLNMKGTKCMVGEGDPEADSVREVAKERVEGELSLFQPSPLHPHPLLQLPPPSSILPLDLSLTCKGTLRQVFIIPEAQEHQNPPPPPYTR